MKSVSYNYQVPVKWLYALIALAIFVNLSGLFTTIIGTDGTLYASIAKTMVQRNNYIELFAKGADWLDKPHLPFWITAFFFKVFGFTTWAYKLPGIICLMMGAYYTFLFAREFYNKEIALWSVLILLTAEHIIISNTDVRAEGYLTGFIIAAVYYFFKVIKTKKFLPILLGSFFTALAIMTKGMFALIPICGATGGGLIIQKQWKEILHIRWLLAALLILIFILPEIYCLYYQFDAHPEKIVFDQQNISGIKFFFWDSQFGRFFNTGPIRGKGDLSFFLHTTLWAFLPWSIWLFCSLFKKIKAFVVKKINDEEWFSISGALITFLLFSLSKFQLPHYLNIVFPFFAIITANYLYHISSFKTIRNIKVTQTIILTMVACLLIALHVFFNADIKWIKLVLIAVLLFSIIVFSSKTFNGIKLIFIKTILISAILNLYLNFFFYPKLLKYQSGSQVAFYANKYYENLPVVALSNYSSPLEFYLNKKYYNVDKTLKGLPAKPFLLYVNSSDSLLSAQNIDNYTLLKTFQDFKISKIKLKFLSSRTRKDAVDRYELFLIK